MATLKNSEFLSQKGKKKKNVKGLSKPVVFDAKAREEYLTGFRKRKLDKIKSAKERYEKLVRQEKAEKRKEKRQKLKSVMDAMLEKMEEDRRLLEPTLVETEVTEYIEDGARTTVVAEPLEL